MQKMVKNCERCGEWQEHCYWSHMADENKHFFKLMVGDFTQSMSLPGRFAKNFNGHISEVINLKPPTGKSWSIKVAGDTDEAVLRPGWKEFVDGHGIREGDLLLFKYSGASSFDVLMFDSTGCQKPPFPRPIKRRGCECDDIAENSARAKGHRCGYHASNKTEEHTPHPPPAANGDGTGLELTLYRGTGRSISRADHEDSEMDHGEAAAKNRYYFCKNGPVSEFHLTEEDKEEISSIPVPVEPRNPVFLNVMHASHVRGTTRTSIVGVSSEFAGKYLGAIGREIVLRRAGRSISRADHEDSEMDHGEAAAKNRYYFCKNGPVSEFHLTEEDKEEISSIPVPVEPRNPVFLNVMHASHVRGTTRTSIVGVSSEFAGKYLGAIGREIVLRRAGRSISRADHEDSEMDHGEAAAKNRYYFCKNGPVSEFHLTEEDKEEISSIPVPVEPRNPVFLNVMHASHVRGTTRTSIVGVSSEFAGKYLGAIGREIVLRRAGRKGGWHVRYTSGDNCRGFCGRGWRDFARDNGLLAHDVCVFELMLGARRPPVANVHVLRRLHGRFVLLR